MSGLSKRLSLIALVLVTVVGPLTSIVPYELGLRIANRSAAGYSLAALFLAFGLLIGWITWDARSAGKKGIDAGWRNRVRPAPLVVALSPITLIAGIFISDGSPPHTISLSMIALSGLMVVIGIMEDLIVRAHIMNTLQERGIPGGTQVLVSSFIYAFYQSIWLLGLSISEAPIFAFVMFFVFMTYGAFLSGLYVWGGRSLVPVVIAHSGSLLFGVPYLPYVLAVYNPH